MGREEDTDYDGSMKELSDLSQGLGCLPGEHTIRVDKNEPPVISPCGKLPFALQKIMKEEIDRMERLKVIERIGEPTDRPSSLVIVNGKNGKPRVCMDARHLNRAIKRVYFKLHTGGEIMSQFANIKYLSKLNASSGFWQLNNETCAHLTVHLADKES